MTTSPSKLIVIPPVRETVQSQAEKKQLRVAAYCRVSTDDEEQLTSYEAQMSYYTDKITSNPDWVMADVFADGPVKIGLNQKHPTARGALV